MSHLLIHNPIIAKSCSNSTSKRSTPTISPFAFTPVLHRPQRIIVPNTCNGKNSVIKCMANPRRVKMVAKQIRRELSDMLLTDKVLQYAFLTEAALGADRYLSSLTTIADVEVSADLQVVKVYVSVFGDERGKEVAMAGLKSKTKYVRSLLGKRMKLRLTPEIRFIEDDSLERGSRVHAILDRIRDENDKIAPEGQSKDLQDSSARSNDEWEGSKLIII
ncbi:probable ribosome-binding factor A, chloroplastic isoform X2 [Olea europaea var. sylvestris]|uniref:probable ribosome-binding factor A, chloroplastic isoform X2 n=1 Tax=Olea europaea var. sylvestris TaxID=158386 RepID=UPI000C1D5BCC|nr:probable ribosome-binding factor A, chloroplastic isoform X2 [Olea europaea var. sylvestris]